VTRAICSAAAVLFLALDPAPVPAQSQRSDSTAARPLEAGGRGRRNLGGRELGQGGQGGQGAAGEQALARQVRQRFAVVIRRQLNLTDDQARQLQTVEQRYQQQRNGLLRDERATRMGLAASMQDTAGTPDQPKIARYLDDLVQEQHRRAALLDSEQKDLAAFLTPLQRAKYQALHEQLNQRIRQMRQNARGGSGAPLPPP
jgi:Spy/CpxP family protein refolding chaperone